jgi:hypothetical protein
MYYGFILTFGEPVSALTDIYNYQGYRDFSLSCMVIAHFAPEGKNLLC